MNLQYNRYYISFRTDSENASSYPFPQQIMHLRLWDQIKSRGDNRYRALYGSLSVAYICYQQSPNHSVFHVLQFVQAKTVGENSQRWNVYCWPYSQKWRRTRSEEGCFNHWNNADRVYDAGWVVCQSLLRQFIVCFFLGSDIPFRINSCSWIYSILLHTRYKSVLNNGCVFILNTEERTMVVNLRTFVILGGYLCFKLTQYYII